MCNIRCPGAYSQAVCKFVTDLNFYSVSDWGWSTSNWGSTSESHTHTHTHTHTKCIRCSVQHDNVSHPCLGVWSGQAHDWSHCCRVLLGHERWAVLSPHPQCVHACPLCAGHQFDPLSRSSGVKGSASTLEKTEDK